MAITAGTTFPCAPHGGMGGVAAGAVLVGIAASGVVKGDILINASGVLTEDNGAPAESAILGVALEDYSSATAELTYAPAYPGKLFEANLINGTSDYTGVFASDIFDAVGFAESDAGHACLDQAAGAVATIVAYGRQVLDADGAHTYPTGWMTSGVGVSNPRCIFVFNSSAFAHIA